MVGLSGATLAVPRYLILAVLNIPEGRVYTPVPRYVDRETRVLAIKRQLIHPHDRAVGELPKRDAAGSDVRPHRDVPEEGGQLHLGLVEVR